MSALFAELSIGIQSSSCIFMAVTGLMALRVLINGAEKGFVRFDL